MKEIKRYCVQGFKDAVPTSNGKYVLLEDHSAIVATKDARISELETMLQKKGVEDGNKIAALQEQVRARRPQSVVELPSNIRTELVNVLTWIERLPVPTASAAAKAIRLRKVISEIDASNVKWEVKK